MRLPRRTVRLRLTLVYACLFLVSGAGLLAITYVLVSQSTGNTLVATHSDGSTFVMSRTRQSSTVGISTDQFQLGFAGVSAARPKEQPVAPAQIRAQIARDQALAKRQHAAEMRQLLEQSGIALAIMAALSIGLGWLAAGRVLRPLRTLNEHARKISASSLHRRLALTGPDDELKQLADAYDDLLGRLEASFAAQRQFVANASHELRTPLARAQAVAEVALGDPVATVDTLRASHRRVIAAGKQQERVIESLLTLARSERGLDDREAFDLAATAEGALAARQESGDGLVEVRSTFGPAQAWGEPNLAERLVANLVDNAFRHNVDSGVVDVTTTTVDGRATVIVANTGPVIAPDDVERLFRPFQRLGRDRIGRSDGVGLGLSIVQAIAAAHQAKLIARPRLGGGLVIEVGFPVPVARERVEPQPRAEPAFSGSPVGATV